MRECLNIKRCHFSCGCVIFTISNQNTAIETAHSSLFVLFLLVCFNAFSNRSKSKHLITLSCLTFFIWSRNISKTFNKYLSSNFLLCFKIDTIVIVALNCNHSTLFDFVVNFKCFASYSSFFLWFFALAGVFNVK